MIPRPFTCCCAVLAIASGFFLYTKKHQTTLLDQQISTIVSETEHVRGQTAMLRTEWALENQPERLAALVVKHAAYLQSMDPAQFVRMADLVQHLPNVVHEPVAVAQASAPAQVAQASKTAAPRGGCQQHHGASAPPQPEREHTLAVADAAPTPPRPLPVRAVRPHPVTVAMESPAQAPHVLVAPAALPPPVAQHDAPIRRVAWHPATSPCRC